MTDEERAKALRQMILQDLAEAKRERDLRLCSSHAQQMAVLKSYARSKGRELTWFKPSRR